ncbi:cytochrome P450 71D9 [Citrus clementina]|nr:cytochrome P450 71D9 [Citrus x clementina]
MTFASLESKKTLSAFLASASFQGAIKTISENSNIAEGANVSDLFASIKFHQLIGGFKSRVQKMHQQADTIMSNIIGEHRKCRAAKSEEEDLVDVLLKVQDQENVERDVKLMDSTYPGKPVIVNAWALGRDSKYWTEPERFIPDRFLECSIDYKGNNFEYIPFGAGRRICPGISFADAIMKLSLVVLLYHFDWTLPNEMKHEDLDMTETFSVGIRTKDDMYIIPTLYHPSPVD